MAELEKLGRKYRVALRIAKDKRFERLKCTHKGTYADDCLVQRVIEVRSRAPSRAVVPRNHGSLTQAIINTACIRMCVCLLDMSSTSATL